MELNGKKIAFLGDSITEGHGVADVKDTFWNVLGRQTGAQVFGYGIGGTRIAAQRHRIEPIDEQHFLTRVDDMIPDADAVVIFGGSVLAVLLPKKRGIGAKSRRSKKRHR